VPVCAGLPDNDVDRAALAADLRAAVGQVEVLDVEREDLGRAAGGWLQRTSRKHSGLGLSYR
jgi:hypothetical protein